MFEGIVINDRTTLFLFNVQIMMFGVRTLCREFYTQRREKRRELVIS